MWVIFDYGGVICSPQPERDVAAMAAVVGCPVPQFHDAYWARRLSYDLAELTAEEYWRATVEQVGCSWDRALTAELGSLDTASWMHLQPGTVRLIEDLATRGTRMALLSNAPCEVAEAVAALPVARHFERLFFSCYLRAAKPDPRCFEAALAVLGAAPSDVIFTDDRADNVEGATRLGIDAIRFTCADGVRERLPVQLT
ncbi:MAG TPA: HAD family phosphatase [Streptosporangiaceae bacterium]|nr:HAD family phosphatase [Streptosporangiaceae bacterium]